MRREFFLELFLRMLFVGVLLSFGSVFFLVVSMCMWFFN